MIFDTVDTYVSDYETQLSIESLATAMMETKRAILGKTIESKTVQRRPAVNELSCYTVDCVVKGSSEVGGRSFFGFRGAYDVNSCITVEVFVSVCPSVFEKNDRQGVGMTRAEVPRDDGNESTSRSKNYGQIALVGIAGETAWVGGEGQMG